MQTMPSLKEKIQLKKIYSFIKKMSPSLRWVLIITASVVIGGLICFGIIKMITGPEGDGATASSESSSEEDSCNVVGINIHGDVVTYITNDSYDEKGNVIYDLTSADEVLYHIKKAEQNDSIKAIMIEVDSRGGSPVGGEEIAEAVKNSKKPVVAYIRSSGDSAAYLSISGADKIFASKFSDVGSIGVTQSYLNNVEKNKKAGYTYEQLSAGKYKDTGDPDKALTVEEKALIMRDINIMYENFVKSVAENRGLTIAKVKSFADGSTVLGEKAKSLGMIDEIGGVNEAGNYIEKTIGEQPDICWK